MRYERQSRQALQDIRDRRGSRGLEGSQRLIAPLLMSVVLSCSWGAHSGASPKGGAQVVPSSQATAHAHKANPELQRGALNPEGRGESVAIFAGGCFWCVEASLEKVKGVKRVISGYSGGSTASPSYAAVSSSQTDHLEAVWVEFDPKVIGYGELVEAFWRTINPTQRDGQFADRGPQYQTAIFYLNEPQKITAARSREALSKSGRFSDPIYTPLREARLFWPAEAYHQDYYKKNSDHYQRYYEGSGRGPFIRRYWGERRSAD